MKVDITSTTLEKGIETVKAFLQKLISPPIEELGLLLGDNVRLWRFKNQIKILQKADEYFKSKNLDPKQIPLKVLVPLLEAASLEEDEDLQNKWAALLVNYVDSTKSFTSTVYPYILAQISTSEAKGLEYIGTNANSKLSTRNKVRYHDVAYRFNLFDANFSNLLRLGVIREVHEVITEPTPTTFGSSTPVVYLKEVPDIQATELGIDFLEACKLKD